jgi:hypothetical protein
MAVENLKSTQITNADAAQITPNNSRVSGSNQFAAVATDECSAAASATSTYRMIRIPSWATNVRVEFASDDTGGTGTVDLGLYRTAADGGAVVDADFFASAIDVSGAAVARANYSHESGVYGIEDAELPLWDAATALTADPQVFYDITITVVAALTNAGTFTVWAYWSE